MVYSVQQIKFEIFGYVKEFGGQFDEWFVGISSEPKKTLSEVHGVDKESDIWLYKQALTFSACRTVQRYFLEIQNTDGLVPPESNENMDCVYLYKKSGRTSP
ncbi:MAG: hypothetical protein V7745_01855 [Pseudomonadales bacterium]